MYDVAVVKYQKPLESLRKAIDLAGGFGDVSADAKVVIKPNVCVWHEGVNFPKYGVLTTARLIEDTVILLKERGAKNIALVEGATENERGSAPLFQLAAKAMGFDILVRRYGVKIVDVHQGAFTECTAGDVGLSVNTDILEADYIVNMPVLKTHSMVKVSLGAKNLKGVLSMASRKTCHHPDQHTDLNYHIAKLVDVISPSFNIIDGIYTIERGPTYGGLAHRSNIIVASKDLISADKVGARVLGFEPRDVPALALLAENHGRPADLGDINIRGEVDVATALKPHRWAPERSESGDLPLAFEKMGIRGLRIPAPDGTLCTYCARLFVDYLMAGILMAADESKVFDDVEILYGKIQDPTRGHKHTVLFGQCQVTKNSENPLINHCVKLRGCSPLKEDLPEAFGELGIHLPEDFLERARKGPETFHGRKYIGRTEFDEAFYRIK